MPPLNDGLTPEEQRFFETGSLETPAAGQPPLDPVALSGLSSGTPPEPVAAPTPAAPAVAAAPVAAAPQPDPLAPQLPDVAEILRRNLQEAQQRVAELELQARAAQKPTTVDAGPDPATDPLGALMHQLGQVQAKISELQSQQVAQQTQQTQLTAFQQFQNNVQALRNQFAAATPDFDAAYAHVRNARIADLQAFGLSQAKINETIFREEVTLAENAINSGKNPAAVIYDMAKRHGYAAAPAAPQAPAAKLEAIAAAQAAAKNLPSQPTAGELSLDNLKTMGDEDLNKLVLNDNLWGQMTGRSSYPL